MAHMYTTPSNAKAAAVAVVKKYPDLIKAVKPPRAPGLTPTFWAAVMLLPGVTLDDKQKTSIEDKVKILDAEPVDDEPADKPAPSPKAGRVAAKAPKPKAKGKSAPKASKEPRVNKSDLARKLMSRKGGVTAKELQDTLGWLPHTVRGFVSIKNSAAKTPTPWNIKTVKGKTSPETRYVIEG